MLSPPLVVAAVVLAIRYWQCGRLIFRTVGANTELQAACRCVLTAQSLLKLDAQLALSTVLLVLHDSGGGGITTTEAVLLGVGFLITLLWWLLGYVALRWESRRLLYVVVATAVLEPIYIAWKLATESRPKGVVLECEWAAAILALLIRVLLVMCLLYCLRGFGKGVNQQSKCTAGGGKSVRWRRG